MALPLQSGRALPAQRKGVARDRVNRVLATGRRLGNRLGFGTRSWAKAGPGNPERGIASPGVTILVIYAAEPETPK